nr:ATP-binding protein [Metallosphaera hakonensis]
MICNIPKVTVTTWSAKNVILAGPTYKRYLEKTLEAVKNKDVASIIGQPGMGKTTILRKTQEEIKGLSFFLDLASKAEIGDEFWEKVDHFKLKEMVLPTLRGKGGKLGYGFLKRITGVKFEDWLVKVCGKYDDLHLRLYCLDYSRNFDGMLRFLSDLKEVTEVTLLMDEVRESHIPEIHRLINAGLGIPIVMAIPTDSYSKVTDLAIRRRLDESRVSLDTALTPEDIREIIDAYCHSLVDDIFPIILSLWNGGELNTVSSMLQYIKSQAENFEKDCGDNLDCVRERVRSFHSLKNPDEDSREIEKLIREVLTSDSKEMEISYVHSRGKRVEAKGKNLVVGVFFIKDEKASWVQ